LLKIGAFLIVAAITLAALFLAWSSFTGRRELAEVKRELLARGEKLSLSELIPPTIPPEDNFFADPLWEEFYPVDITKSSEPRVPKGQRQIDALDRPASDPEFQKLAASRPELAGPGSSVLAFLLKLGVREHTADLPRRRAAAEFTLAALAYAQPTLDHLGQLAERPGARFPYRYEDVFAMRLEPVTDLLKIAQMFFLRARAAGTLGQREAAFRDTMTLFRLAEVNAREPMLINHLVRLSIESMALSSISQGIEAHLWTDADLQEFNRLLSRRDIIPSLAVALRGERGSFNEFLEHLRKNPGEFMQVITQGVEDGPKASSPAGTLAASFYLSTFAPGDQAFYNRLVQKWIDGVEKSRETGLNSQTLSDREILALKANMRDATRKLLSALALPAISSATRKFVQTQDEVQLSRAACALERYWLAHGGYPDTLTALVPEFLPALPVDTVTLQPVHYRKNDQGDFLLWTPGWNEKDDGGVETTRTKAADWVWGKPNKGN